MNRFIAITVVAFVTAGTLCGEIAEAGQIINGGFETGDFSGWQTLGNTSIQTANFGISPTEGDFQALLENHPPGFNGIPTDQVESFLGMSSGSLSALGNGPVIQGSAIQQTFAANAGDLLSFNWNFLTNENASDPVFNDFAFVTIRPGPLVTLASTFSNLIPAPVPTYFSMTDYQSYTYTIPTTGIYTLGIGVVDVSDEFTDSGLLVDNASLSTGAVPEPSSLLLCGIGFLGLLSYTGWSRRASAARDPDKPDHLGK